MSNKLVTLEQARQQAQSSRDYTDAQIAEVAEAAAESIAEVANELPVSTTVTLRAAGWSNNSQTIAVEDVTATNTILVSAASASADAYSAASISCTAQALRTLTFTCASVPSADLQVDLVIIH